jgi:hypothetical protein
MAQHGSTRSTAVSLDHPALASTERRLDKRHLAVLRIGKIIAATREDLCMIRNISGGGLMAHVYGPLAVGQPISVEIKNGHVLTGSVAWADCRNMGMQFDERIDVLQFLANEQFDLMKGQIPRNPRLRTNADVLIRRGAHYVHARVADISPGGARVTEGDAFDAQDDVVMTIAGLPARAGTVRWRRDGHAGIGFHEPTPFDVLARWAAQQGADAG